LKVRKIAVMTMIVAAHLEDCILIAADKRAMLCNLETGAMHLSNDDEQKIRLWNRGAIVGTGDTVFVNRVADYFINFQESDSQFKQMDAIYEELERRILEGVPQSHLKNNSLIFSIFDGEMTGLYLVPIGPFFNVIEKNGQKIIQPEMHQVTPYCIDVTCFNMPPDMSCLQNFQHHLRSLSSFESELEFIGYYISQLKQVFVEHAQIDPSITSSFDLYIQSCSTGKSIAMHVENLRLSLPIPKNLNYWDRNS